MRFYRGKRLHIWNDLICLKESTFHLFESDGKVMVWRSTKEERDSKCIVSKVKHNKTNVKLWGMFFSVGYWNSCFHWWENEYRSVIRNFQEESFKICQEIVHGSPLDLSTRQRSETYYCYCDTTGWIKWKLTDSNGLLCLPI